MVFTVEVKRRLTSRTRNPGLHHWALTGVATGLISADFYTSDDRVNGVTRGISLAPGVAIPRPPKPETLLNPNWSHVHNQDKAAMVRGEFDVNDQVMAYAAFGVSKTDYEYNGAMSAQVLNAAGDFKTAMGQLASEQKKRSAEMGLKGRLQTGAIKHQWALNATHYAHKQDDYGRRSVPGADWTTNLYNPVWGPEAPLLRRTSRTPRCA